MSFKFISGFSLIEVLLSLTLLSFALLAMDAMEVDALQSAGATYNLSLAEFQMRNITERLLMLGPHSGFDALKNRWNRENQEILPLGRGVMTGHFPHYTVTLRWGALEKNCDEIISGNSGCLKADINFMA